MPPPQGGGFFIAAYQARQESYSERKTMRGGTSHKSFGRDGMKPLCRSSLLPETANVLYSSIRTSKLRIPHVTGFGEGCVEGEGLGEVVRGMPLGGEGHVAPQQVAVVRVGTVLNNLHGAFTG